MAAIDAEERGQLIPHLPEQLVLAHVVPRLPWYTRPLCRALSKSWRAVLDTRNPDLDLRTRTIQLPALRGLFLFATFDTHIFIRDNDVHDPWHTKAYKIQPQWRRLPPLDGLARTFSLASSGMVYVWSHEDGVDILLKLDVGCAQWAWKKLPVPYLFQFEAVSCNDKIYVPMSRWASFADSPHREHGILVLDMMTDECRLMETSNENNLRVMSECRQSNLHIEEMYCFVGHDLDPKVEVLMYDVESDSWRTHEKVPVPPMKSPYRFHIKLLNSDCFEPAPEWGINIIWVNHHNKSFFWFNSSVGKAWVEVGFNPVMEGRRLSHLESICGSLYGIFADKREEEEDIGEEEDGGGSSILSRSTIMKGIVIVASKSVAWEEVHEDKLACSNGERPASRLGSSSAQHHQ